MTWTLVGKIKTEPFDGGSAEERVCGACGRDAKFEEHDSARGRVMVCGECGVAFKSGAASERPATPIDDAVDRATDAAIPLWERAAEAAKDAIERASEGFTPLAKKAGEAFGRIAENAKTIASKSEEEPAEDEDPEKAELLRRFAELEKKMKDRRGD